MHWKGAHDPNRLYRRGNEVMDGGVLYVCILDTSASFPAPAPGDDSTHWTPQASGASVRPFMAPPPLSEWTWVNHGPYDDPTDYPLLVTAEDIPDGIRFTAPGPTNFPGIIVANDPLPEPPYTITVAINTGASSLHTEAGIILRNSSTGYSIVSQPFPLNASNWQSDIYDFTATPTSFEYVFSIGQSGSLFTPFNSTFWFRIQNDGSELHAFISSDTRSFVEIGGVDSSGSGVLDEYGLMFYNYDNASITGAPHLEVYYSERAEGRLIVDFLSLEVVTELVITTPFLIV